MVILPERTKGRHAEEKERTKDDFLSIGIWPEKFHPAEMLQKGNDGNRMFEVNQMTVPIPLDTKGFPNEVP